MDREAIALHGRLTSTRRRWDQARQLVAHHLAASPRSYVSWSGGKDSTAVAALTAELDPAVPMVRFSRGVDFPEVVTFCADIAAARGWDYRVSAEPLPPDLGVDHDRARSAHDAIVVWSTLCDTLGWEPSGWLYGLRIDESDDRRRLLASTRGSWVGADGHHVCAPCWNWSALDIAAYLQHRGIPLCPVYDRLIDLGAPEGAWRVGYMVGPGGARMGRYTWLKRGWPDQWARLVQQIPWLRDVS